MSAICQLTGATPRSGNTISHSHVRTKRKFRPNIQTKTYYAPALRRTVKLRLSARGVKTIDRIGIDAAVARIQARGGRV